MLCVVSLSIAKIIQKKKTHRIFCVWWKCLRASERLLTTTAKIGNGLGMENAIMFGDNVWNEWIKDLNANEKSPKFPSLMDSNRSLIAVDIILLPFVNLIVFSLWDSRTWMANWFNGNQFYVYHIRRLLVCKVLRNQNIRHSPFLHGKKVCIYSLFISFFVYRTQECAPRSKIQDPRPIKMVSNIIFVVFMTHKEPTQF